MVKAKLRERLNHTRQAQQQSKKRWDIEKFMNTNKALEYQNSIEKKIQLRIKEREEQDIDEEWLQIESIIKETAEEVTGEK